MCTFYSRQNVKVYYSSVGYFEQYQYYIAKVDVTFDSQKTISSVELPADINFQYSIEFIDVDQILNEVKENPRSSILPQLPSVSSCLGFIN